MLQDTPGGTSNMHATVSAHLRLAPQEHRVRGWIKDTETGSEPCGRSRCVSYHKISTLEGGDLPKDRANHGELTVDSASRSRDSPLGSKFLGDDVRLVACEPPLADEW